MNSNIYKLLILIGCCVFLSGIGTALAQTTGTITGSIHSEKGEPLSGINVVLEGTGRGTTTDADGAFTIDRVPAGTYTLKATGIGYEARKQNVTVTADRVTTLNLRLNMATYELEEILVTGIRLPEFEKAFDESKAGTEVEPKVVQDYNPANNYDALRVVPGIAAVGGWILTLLPGGSIIWAGLLAMLLGRWLADAYVESSSSSTLSRPANHSVPTESCSLQQGEDVMSELKLLAQSDHTAVYCCLAWKKEETMSEPKILAHNRQSDHSTCVYRCDAGGLHVFYSYVNIGMPSANFRQFSQNVTETLERIQAGEWDTPCVNLHYWTTTVVIPVEEFVPFAFTIQQATRVLELEESSYVEPEDGSHDLPEAIPPDIYHRLYQDGLN